MSRAASLPSELIYAPETRLDLNITFPATYGLDSAKWVEFKVRKNLSGPVIFSADLAGSSISISGDIATISLTPDAANSVVGGGDWQAVTDEFASLEFGIDIGSDSDTDITDYRVQGNIATIAKFGSTGVLAESTAAITLSFVTETISISFAGQGAAGAAGEGLPAGGTTGQIPIKASGTDYDVTWSDIGAGSGDVVGPASATADSLAQFSGTTGKLLKDGPAISAFGVSLIDDADADAGRTTLGLGTAATTASTAYATAAQGTTADSATQPGDALSSLDTTVTGAQLDSIKTDVDNLGTAANSATGDFEPAKGADDNFVTDAEKVVVGNTSGTNTGDQDLSGYALTSSLGTAGVLDVGTTANLVVQLNASAELPAVSGANLTSLPSGATELSDLSDVGTSAITNRNALVADGTDFKSRALVEADISDMGTYSTATGVEDNADVTDTANVTSSGALMDSEVTNLAAVKAFDSADYAATLGADDNYVTDAEKTIVGNTSGTNTGDQDLSGLQPKPSEGQFADGDKTKLDAITGTNTGDQDLTPYDDGQLGIVIDGAGTAITTGYAGELRIPYDCTISGVELMADQSGSIVIDVWKDTYANAPLTDADSITASAPPTLSTAQKSVDSTLTGWTTSLTKGDYLAFSVDSAATITRITLTLIVSKA
tara:strand:- start:4974 stop:6959 length:1986 start_codon:yes stop_codon:yes gene_type:complete